MKNTAKIISALLAAALFLSLCSCIMPGPAGADTVTAKETDKAKDSSTGSQDPAATTEAEQTAELPYKVVTASAAAVGDVIIAGSYEQDGDGSNGKEPLEWLVLDRSGNSLLVITLYAVESMKFNETRDYVTWETSDLRSWLNGPFYQTAFTEGEKTAIKTTTVIAELNPEHREVSAGGDTEDKIFLLSLQETDKYFKEPGDKACSPTPAVAAKGSFTKSNKKKYVLTDYACIWWLRSPGMDKLKIADVDKGGTASYSGTQIDMTACVRPAMWITVN
ncbi:MAG: hypothetical protein J5585_04515 [Clostridia bacterium]|nr:hypothetical protein [Clostridia bacterium]